MALRDGTPFSIFIITRLLFLAGLSAVVYALGRILAAFGVTL